MSQNIMVKKFGGTSLASLKRIKHVAGCIENSLAEGMRPVVVVSAMAGETNRLIRMAHQAAGLKYKGLAYDMLLASGEQVSAAVLALTLQRRKILATPLLAHQAGIQTDNLFSKARIQKINTSPLKKLLRAGFVPIVAGFQGSTVEGTITTLGRGGSDTTALALAAALKQKTCEIFTDVPKIYTADPRLLKTAVPVSHLSFEEMMEMASQGSRVLHFRCVEIAAKYNIKIHVRSTFKKEEGTWITRKEEIMESHLVSFVTCEPDTVIVKLFPIPRGVGFMARLFKSLAKKSISLDVISQSYNKEGQRLAFSINSEDLEEVKNTLYHHMEKNKVYVVKNLAKLSVVGVGMASHPGAAARFFDVLHKVGVNLHLTTTSEIKISAVIDKKHLKAALQAVHKEFGLSKSPHQI